ncbi:MAG: SMP-30/gluconolactonase/LRE family protein [Xanthomonadales bacterium]|nr:SMP-30/gluconolactonase/LRE family protein [Xanthomonadales bacterium]
MGAFTVSSDQLGTYGHGLQRPECVLCTADGSVWTSCWPGGVTQVRPDGTQHNIIATNLPFELYPNGIALLPDGSFLLANLGQQGGVWRLQRDGTAEAFLLEVAGRPLPPSNFVTLDHLNRVWITVSTWHNPRSLAYRKTVADGFIVRVDNSGARVVAEGLGFTNELLLDANRGWLYVNETFARRLSRYRLDAAGLLYNKQIVAEFGAGSFPDGLAMDEEGGIWIASIISNRVMRLAPNGTLDIILEDSNAEHLAWVEQAYAENRMDRLQMDTMNSKHLKSISSIAFGGPARSTAYLGCLLGEQLHCFDAPVRGLAPVHWNWAEAN